MAPVCVCTRLIRLLTFYVCFVHLREQSIHLRQRVVLYHAGRTKMAVHPTTILELRGMPCFSGTSAAC